MSSARQLSLESLSAYRMASTNAATIRELVYAHALARGERGITADEIAELWGCSPNHVAPRISELKKAGRLVRSEQTRKTRAGCAARVLVAV